MKTAVMVAQEVHVMSMTESALLGYRVKKAMQIFEAVGLLQKQDFDLFIIGIHFDESRGLELLTYIRSLPKYQHTPVIILRLLPSNIAQILRNNINALIRMNVVNMYLELENDPDATLKIRQAADSLVSPQKHHLEAI